MHLNKVDKYLQIDPLWSVRSLTLLVYFTGTSDIPRWEYAVLESGATSRPAWSQRPRRQPSGQAWLQGTDEEAHSRGLCTRPLQHSVWAEPRSRAAGSGNEPRGAAWTQACQDPENAENPTQPSVNSIRTLRSWGRGVGQLCQRLSGSSAQGSDY